ncbi:unnamed protein product [Prunus armeniaca]|uniref:Uncharacterized protein n=1 Tax=Prunus armeniaca TaxID=36596 RepID=A0A6J5U276_PRUAR|nr:unnamed protein product [Prunus armeniaca]CAB4300672.1 unnamed protein product [Prunus armeniaca]
MKCNPYLLILKSLCLNSHASDVAYVSSSGSIIAVAGYSSINVNVVIWDTYTLAPPTTYHLPPHGLLSFVMKGESPRNL